MIMPVLSCYACPFLFLALNPNRLALCMSEMYAVLDAAYTRGFVVMRITAAFLFLVLLCVAVGCGNAELEKAKRIADATLAKQDAAIELNSAREREAKYKDNLAQFTALTAKDTSDEKQATLAKLEKRVQDAELAVNQAEAKVKELEGQAGKN